MGDPAETHQPAEAATIPLARLFAMAYYHFVEALHRRLDEAGWHDVRPSYGFVLLAARDQPITPRQVAELMGTTKQAASVLVSRMQDAGYLQPARSTSDGRVRAVTLTSRSRELLGVVESIYADLESEWAGVLGGRRLETLRGDLLTALRASHGGRLPGIRPTK
jgi:DNA-binding MarR family transcriptional regulator